MKLDYCAIGVRVKERRTKKEWWGREMLVGLCWNFQSTYE